MRRNPGIDRVAHTIFWQQNVTTSVLLGVKQIVLGNEGTGFPGLFGKPKRLDILEIKRNFA